MVYFDNAATSYPKPQEVIFAVGNALTDFGGNPGRSGHKMSLKAAQSVYRMREKAATFFGLEQSENVILTKNCTESLNLAIYSVMRHGGNVIVSHFEHNSVMRPLEQLRRSGVCDYKVAKVSFENPMLTAHEFERLIDAETRMILCTHASNVTGKIAPIEALADICRRRQLVFCVDAAQTAGVADIHMTRDHIDILCMPGHKGLMGPAGTGLALFSSGVSPSPLLYGGTGSTSGSLQQPDFLPDMLESGTVNVPGAAGICAGISFIQRIGLTRIRHHEMYLAQRFYDRLIQMSNILLYTTRPSEETSVATVSFNVKGKASTDVSDYLDKKGFAVRSGLHCAPYAHAFLGTRDIGTVRVSFSFFNCAHEVDALCAALEKIK